MHTFNPLTFCITPGLATAPADTGVTRRCATCALLLPHAGALRSQGGVR